MFLFTSVDMRWQERHDTLQQPTWCGFNLCYFVGLKICIFNMLSDRCNNLLPEYIVMLK